MHWRRINVDGIEWRYHVGRSFVVARRGKMKLTISFAELTGLSWHEVERGIWKRWFTITPRDIASWLYRKDLQC